MTKAVYVVGGAGVGKSTFTGQLLERLGGLAMGPLEDLHSKPNTKAVVTLRGHRIGERGMYLGCMRDSFPGTDGLDRASSPTGEEWLDLGKHRELDFILAEGATLATRRFITALHRHTELLLVHLVCLDEVKRERLDGRGSNQADSFILGTATRSFNLVSDMRKLGVEVLGIDTSEEFDWEVGLDICVAYAEERSLRRA